MSHACHRFLEMPENPHVLLTFDKVHNPLRLPRESTSERPKVVRTLDVFNILTSKCASRHNSVHFFDIATAKSGPTLLCFVHFDLEMCFAPQRRAIFRLSSGQLAPHPPLAHLDLLSSETFSFLIFFLSSSLLFSSLTLPISAFHLSILSEV